MAEKTFNPPTHGHKGWMPLKFFAGKNPDGTVRTKEGYKNVVNSQEFIPEGGWKVDPPGPTGDMSNCRFNARKYRENYGQINWEVKP